MSALPPSAASARRASWIAVVALALAGLASYHATFSAPFFFDDLPAITDNPSIRHLHDLGAVLSPPAANGNSVGGRPLVNLSLAINYAISGEEVWSYHALNLAIHILAALTLFGAARRTLGWSALSSTRLSANGVTQRVGDNALHPSFTAFTISLLWLLHPLLTESVTCVVQRTESLMGLFYLLTLYSFIRYAEVDGAAEARRPPPRSGGRLASVSPPPASVSPPPASASPRPASGSTRWAALSVLACLCGMATKEVMVTAPVLVFLYDRTFISGSFGNAWRRHRRAHLGLAATWLLLAALLIGTGGSRGASAGFGFGLSPWAYALTQCRAIVHYLRLSFWPHPLVVDYGTAAAASVAEVLPQAILLLLLLSGTAIALWRRPVIGFFGAWFFILLAPSSSFVPLVTQTIAEHRMYLPLAAVIAGSVLALRAWAGRRALFGCLALALLWGGLTLRRNQDYRSTVAIWSATVACQPDNARAHNDLGDALRKAGRIPEAIAQCREAVRLQPAMPEAHYNLGGALLDAGRPAEAADEYREALRLRPGFALPHVILGGMLLDQGSTAEAMAQFTEALRLDPDSFEGHYNFGNALFRLGQAAEAARQYALALAIRPDSLEANYNAANALVQTGNLEAAIGRFQLALRLRPDFADAHFNLAGALAAAGRTAEAIGQYQEVLRLQPGSADARERLISLKALPPP